MTDTFQEQAQKLIDAGQVQSVDDCLLLAAGDLVAAIRLWLDEAYKAPGEEVPHGVTHTNLGDAHFWLLDRRLTSQEIITALSRRRIIAEARKIGRLDAVYIPPQSIARGKRAQWN